MPITKSGILYLTASEREALRVLISHVQRDIGYDAGGTFALNPGQDEEMDKLEVKKAKRGIDVVEFVLEITK